MKGNLFILFIFTIFYFTASIQNLNYIDTDADEIGSALSAIKILKGSNLSYPGSEIEIFGKKFPMTVAEGYLFALPNYLYIPVFYLFGISIYSLRMLPIVLSYLTVIMIYYITKYYFNGRIALITALLVGTDFRFIHYGKVGLLVTEPFMNYFIYLSVVLFVCCKKYNKNIYLYLASFILGCGLSIKMSAIARYAGIIGAGLAVFPLKTIFIQKTFNIRKWILLAILFALGAALFIAFNVRMEAESFKYARFIFNGQTTRLGTDNSKVWQNMKARIRQYNEIIGGYEAERAIPYSGDSYKYPIFVYLFYISFVCNIIIYNMRLIEKPEFASVIFVYVFFLVVFAFSLFSPNTIRRFHLIAMYPFEHFTIALFISNIGSIIERRNTRLVALAGRSLPIALSIVLLTINLKAVYAYNSVFAEGENTFGNTYFFMQELSSYLKERDLKPLCSVTYELMFKTMYFTEGKVYDVEFIGGSNMPIQRDRLNYLLSKHKKIYIIQSEYNSNSYPKDKGNEELYVFLAKTHRKIAIIKQIRNPEGVLLYSVLEVGKS